MKKVRINPYESTNAENSTFETTSFLFSINQRNRLEIQTGLRSLWFFQFFLTTCICYLRLLKNLIPDEELIVGTEDFLCVDCTKYFVWLKNLSKVQPRFMMHRKILSSLALDFHMFLVQILIDWDIIVSSWWFLEC